VGFPATRHSVLLLAAGADPQARREALGTLIEGYWRPVYKYLRLRWQASDDEARDLTQSFFAAALDGAMLRRYDPGKARFRTFLRLCLDGFVLNERKAARRLKRGGGTTLLALDFESADGELRGLELPDGTDLDAWFHREWVRALFAQAVDELRARCAAAGKTAALALFERYDLQDPGPEGRPTYAQLAAEFGLPATQVTNFLAWARREFRAAVLSRLRALTASDEEFRGEARALLGLEPPP
jgi:DNA-directed RNA polymerase specialized sigma24 family protein